MRPDIERQGVVVTAHKPRPVWTPLVCALLCLLAGVGLEAAELKGPAFSDPAHSEVMPEDWRAKLIDRSQWQEPDGAPVDLAVTLDQHLYPALKPLIAEFARTHQLRIALQEGTCGISAGKLMDKEADIGGFCCPPGETDRLPGLHYHNLGIAALALLVNPDNPLQELGLAQARDVFQGRISRWQQLGVSDAEQNKGRVQPVVRLHCKARPGHWRLLLDNPDLYGPGVFEVSTIPDMIARVADKPDAIGYETLWMTERHRDRGKVKTLRLNGIAPEDRAALAQGRYPLYRSYYISTWTDKVNRRPQAEVLAKYLVENFSRVDTRYGIIPASELRQHGWVFQGTELIGEPVSR